MVAVVQGVVDDDDDDDDEGVSVMPVVRVPAECRFVAASRPSKCLRKGFQTRRDDDDDDKEEEESGATSGPPNPSKLI